MEIWEGVLQSTEEVGWQSWLGAVAGGAGMASLLLKLENLSATSNERTEGSELCRAVPRRGAQLCTHWHGMVLLSPILVPKLQQV